MKKIYAAPSMALCMINDADIIATSFLFNMEGDTVQLSNESDFELWVAE